MVKGDAVGGGSPLWMSPEALLDELPLTEKNDVYAFGLVLWEILTQKPLFQEYTDIELFTDDIARKGLRPTLEGVGPELQELVKDCWDKKQDTRPSFQDLITRIKKLRLTLNIPASLCADAGKLWEKGGWLNQYEAVPLCDFVNVLYEAKKPTSRPEILSHTKCIAQICDHDHDNLEKKEMTLENFAKLLKWFGPVKQGGDKTSILEIISETVNKPWFFGVLSREESELRLDPYKAAPGHYLVRLNAGGNMTIEACPYTISRVVQDAEEPIVHTRIQPSKAGGFFVKIGENNYKAPSLHALITKIEVSGAPECSIVCPGHPFSNIFTVKKAFQYQEVQEEEEGEKKEKEEEKPKKSGKSTSEGSKKVSGSKKKSSTTKTKKEAK